MQLEVGAVVEGRVTGITNFGAFIDLGDGKVGMVHISEVANTFVKEIRDHLQENQVVKVRIMSIGENGKINLSIKKAVEQPQQRSGARPQQNRAPGGPRPRPASGEPMSFEDMMNKFKQSSDEKMSDLKRYTNGKRGSSRKPSHK